MRRLLLVIAVAFLLATAGCADTSDDDLTEEIEDSADTDDPAEPDDKNKTGDKSAETNDSADDDDADDKDPPDSDVDGELEVHAINVGQADATLLVGPTGDTMLIDSGDWTDDGETVLEYLDSLGIDRLDHLVSTHAHADHIGGHAAVIEEFETEKHGVTLFKAQEGDTKALY